MARPLSTVLSLIAWAAVLVTSTSCQEHRRLEAETAALKRQYDEDVRPQVQKYVDEMNHYAKVKIDVMNERTRANQEAFTPTGAKALEEEVSALQADKSRLEKDIQAIEEEHQQYKNATS